MKKIGRQTLELENYPYILETASIVGPKEQDGPLGKYFDKCIEDEFWGEKTWEKAESKFIRETANACMHKAGIGSKQIDYMFAGDLLNQCIASCFGFRDSNIPYFGVFGACSTFVESLILGSVFIDSTACNNILCATSSHFCSAEKQFRSPLELGTQRTPTNQWTVTGAGAVILSKKSDNCPHITFLTPGIITDLGIKDSNNMGAAMAPAALSTLKSHLEDTGRDTNYYDAIITGDLGYVGKDILVDIARTEGIELSDNYNDTGIMMFQKQKQDTHSGGSGAACVSTVFSGYLYKLLKEHKINKLLLIATGALTNATTAQQGESIPGIAHAIAIEN